MTELERLLSQDDCCLVSVISIKKALEQESFINKPCISIGVCHEDKVKVLDKIRADVEKLPITDTAVKLVIKTIDKYKTESEEWNEL